jgi:sensor domain CHASE-containing protein
MPLFFPSRSNRLFGALTLVAVLLLGTVQIVLTERLRVAARKAEALAAAAGYAQQLTSIINRALSGTYALASMVRVGKGKVENFEAIAGDMLKLYGDVGSLQLAPNGVITYVVPLAGNEKAVGHDLLKDEKRNKEARAALQTRKLTLAGPFELLQGGTAVIGRLPIFLTEDDGTERFWGFSTALIRIPELLKRARLQELTAQGYRFELWRIHPDSGARQVFASSSTHVLHAPVDHQFDVPNAQWTLSLEPAGGWISWGWIAVEGTAWALVGALAALLLPSRVRSLP